ncbi:putative uncharacterized protein [Alistipes sp. CAG:268]|uniref:GIN domain-containing protein n=1 Tax=Alistipes sp. CAG:268 TaxID=1262693 RepID=UPI00033DB9BD|nr:DUF2807 domain-containing protein [Alistipes sp. CAG:268]CDC95646.1 putative uncharacterized protein [Alistipes sp. CAG:268]
MKKMFLLIVALGAAFYAEGSSSDPAMRQAVADIRAAIDDFEQTAPGRQTLDELNAAAREEVVRLLNLSARQRKVFDPIYASYREALERAVRSVSDPVTADDARQRTVLKERLSNIAAVAQVKRDYVDRFAEVLTAEQIRQLYNAEGQIGTSIKRAAGGSTGSKRAAGERRTEMPRVLSGSGRRVSQDWGTAGDYTAIETGAFFHVTVSPTARTITVTADDNVIDYLKLDRTGGRLAFSLLPRSGRTRRIENLSISVVVPVSASLREISVGSYAGFESATPLRVKNLSVSVSSYGSVKADIVDSGDSRLQVSSYGRFTGKVESAGAQLTVASYGTFEGPLSCVGTAAVSVGSYGSFNGDIRAAQADLSVSSGGKFSGALRADAASVGVSSYARFSGPIDVSELKASVSSSGVLQSAFAGRRCEASVASYGKLVFTGSADVEAVSVQLSPQSSFSAPDLRVKRYDIRTSSYSKADVWCSESLRVDAAATSQVTYDGPCRLEAQTSTVRRR